MHFHNLITFKAMIAVSCALIINQNRVLICQRSAAMKHPLKWEFPGGKIELGETAEECLKREIREELGLSIALESKMSILEHHYPDVAVCLHPFRCKLLTGHMKLLEHAQAIWVLPENLWEYDWVAADVPIVKEFLLSQGLE